MKHIVIVGGGTSGWLTAAYLAAKLGTAKSSDLAFTLIESSDIPTVGVGEATTSSIRATLADIGFNEFDFMRLCDATFKHGILFKNWTHSQCISSNDEYFHPFERPLRAGTDGMESYWLKGLDYKKRPFYDALSIQHQIARAGLSPKLASSTSYDSPLPYAYHLDAGKLAQALKQAAKSRGVKHIIATVKNVQHSDAKGIEQLLLSNGETISADLFIDCSGFSSLLINHVTKDNFKDFSDVLLCDSAVTVQIPHLPHTAPLPYTTSTAVSNGWIWDIGLNTRRGSGYVFSSKHTNSHAVEQELAKYIGQSTQSCNFRHMTFPVGYRPKQWFKNCVAIGLSSGFIEPLESTGIHLVEQGIWALASLLPRYFNEVNCEKNFNDLMSSHYEHAIHFVKYHYILSRRDDSTFWTDNVNPDTWTPWLKDMHNIWHHGYPDVYDFQNLHSIFDHGSYQYVYFGMHSLPQLSEIGGRRDAFAEQIFKRISDGVSNAGKRLIPHQQALNGIHTRTMDSPKFEVNELKYAKANASIRAIPSNYKTGI